MTTFDFSLPGNANKIINLSEYKGKKNIVLYFYPKDNTPGCTIEANDFNNKISDFAANDTIVIGVSADNVASHDKFIAKYELNFDLISDFDKELCSKLGVWVEKSMYGKKYMGIERSTFLLNKNQEIVKEWRKVKVKNHVEEVLGAVKNI
ncbi:peroxiredoxin [Rickettsiales bacterium]|nr:peroxiredoxin [Rickettsiales bacterium]